MSFARNFGIARRKRFFKHALRKDGASSVADALFLISLFIETNDVFVGEVASGIGGLETRNKAVEKLRNLELEDRKLNVS